RRPTLCQNPRQSQIFVEEGTMGGSGTAWDHPGRRELEDFLASRLPAERTRAVLRHLIPGCAACSAAMAELHASPTDAYDLPIGRAFAFARRLHEAREKTGAELPQPEPPPPANEELAADPAPLDGRNAGGRLETMFDLARDARGEDPRL